MLGEPADLLEESNGNLHILLDEHLLLALRRVLSCLCCYVLGSVGVASSIVLLVGVVASSSGTPSHNTKWVGVQVLL